jgi:phosphoglycerate dehydrogenase-like enzyme
MTDAPVVTVVLHPRVREDMLAPADLDRLGDLADVRVAEFDGPVGLQPDAAVDAEQEARLAELAASSDALVVAHGCPRVTEAVFAGAPSLRFVGELEGDRFFGRIDTAAAERHGVTVVDTTHGSSWPVAEWALALAILGRRDAGRVIRALYAHEHVDTGGHGAPQRLVHGELSGATIGLIGFGHIAWRLVELLRPFDVEVLAHDPYAPRELAEPCGVTFAPLDAVFGTADVVICLAPLTPGTRGLIGADQLGLLRPGAVFVNVSRGAVVQSEALLDSAREDRVVFCLDVFDPEPIPTDHPIRDLPNVLLTPHIAGTTVESRRRFFTLMVDELIRHLAGTEPRAQVTSRVLAGRGTTGVTA